MNYILYNPLANNNKGHAEVVEIKKIIQDENAVEMDLVEMDSFKDFFATVKAEDKIILCGGDGTLTWFTRETEKLTLPANTWYYAAGTGNDFSHDITEESFPEKKLIHLNKYLEKLPVVTVNGKEYSFINGIGFGIDGYCCEAGDDLKAKSTEDINYAGIAIKGILLGKFRPSNATVTIDGVTKHYKKVWLAPTMYGRYYGGGMKVAPSQDRLSPERTVTLVVWHGGSRLGTLIRFPSIFKGEHIKYRKHIHLYVGHEIKVEFDKPQALQIDGETIRNVTSYSVCYR